MKKRRKSKDTGIKKETIIAIAAIAILVISAVIYLLPSDKDISDDSQKSDAQLAREGYSNLKTAEDDFRAIDEALGFLE